MALSDIVPWRSGGLRQQDERPFDIFRDEMESLHRGLGCSKMHRVAHSRPVS